MDWDFPEDCYRVYHRDGFPYKVLNTHNNKVSKNVANKLHKFRKINEDVIKKNMGTMYKTPETDLYLKTEYLLSEMKPNTGFDGLNKPRELVETQEPPIGKDGRLRASWKDIFLTINPYSPEISSKEMDLFIHELAHTGCNHITWRDDDHGQDFKNFENILWDCLTCQPIWEHKS